MRRSSSHFIRRCTLLKKGRSMVVTAALRPVRITYPTVREMEGRATQPAEGLAIAASGALELSL